MDEFRQRSMERGTRGLWRPNIRTERINSDTKDKAMAAICLQLGAETLWVLLERPFEGHRLTFPGGDVERGEAVIVAVVREVWEEAAIDLSKEAATAECPGRFPLGSRRRGDIYVYFFRKILPDLSGLRQSGEGVVTLLTTDQLLEAYYSGRFTENAEQAMRLLLAHQPPTA